MLVLVSRRAYLRVTNVGLNERYRLAENARTTHMLFWWCAASSVRNAVVFACNTLIGWYFIPRKDYYGIVIMSATFDLTIALYCVLAPLVIIFSHGELSKHMKRKILRRREITVESALAIRNVLGKPLIIDVSEHQQEYFKALQAAWGE